MRIKVVAVCMVALLLAFGAQALAQSPLSMTAAKVSKAPVIDGDLSDDAWLQASKMGGKVVIDLNEISTTICEFPRVAYLAYDDANLYVAFIVFSPDANLLEIFGASITANDEVEINLQPQPGSDWAKVTFDANGTILSRTVIEGVTKYNAFDDAVKYAMTKEGTRWVVEMAIPFSEVGATPKTGDIWRAGLFGHQVSAGQFWITWSPTKGNFNDSTYYGNLVFGE